MFSAPGRVYDTKERKLCDLLSAQAAGWEERTRMSPLLPLVARMPMPGSDVEGHVVSRRAKATSPLMGKVRQLDGWRASCLTRDLGTTASFR